jgi:membrane protein required for colicin V production
MAAIDIIILVFAALMCVLGFRKGFIISLASLAALFLGIYIAVYFSHFVSKLIQSAFDTTSVFLPAISFAVTFFLVIIGVLLLGKAIEKMVNLTGMGFLNHLAGALMGLVEAVLILSVVFYVIRLIDPHGEVITREAKEKSIFYDRVASVAPSLIEWTGIKLTF